MKQILVLGLAGFLVSCGNNTGESLQSVKGFAQIENAESSDEIDADQGVMTPEQEVEYEKTYFPGSTKAFTYKFAQTNWKECVDTVTGNYTGYNCASSRGISVMLKTFMDQHMYKCVNAGLAAQGGGTVLDYHIVHAGIKGDPNHSPRSMHAENRAIDIKSMEVKLTSGAVRNFVFAGSTNSAYFNAFRSCWGGVVNKYNSCPLYKGSATLTGSIGKEDGNHQYHMHTSVPYCVSGSYGPYYYQK
jgi:hypothetical protein